VDAAKKDCILLEAARAFARFGFKKTSIDDIAREAGVGKGTVYLAAESKEDLYYQVLLRELRAWQADCGKLLDPREPADELLAKLLAKSMDHLEKHPLLLELLIGETQKILPDWADELAELRAAGRQNVAEVLRIGVRQKRFRDDLDVDTVSALLQEMQLVLFRPARDSKATMGDRARVGLDLVLNGLRARHARA
jgi:AcrR family transcriptional regulator